MPVKFETIVKCSVCRREKTAVNRWFLVKVKGTCFTYRDFDLNQLRYYDEAVCGIGCLDTKIRHHAEGLVGISSVSSTPQPEALVHGVTCKKVPHTGTAYVHDEADDGPYDVDGIDYCGRCHRAI